MATKTPLVELAAAGTGDRAEVGGKARALAELAGAGFPVPPGFVVTASALDRDPDAVDRAIAEAADRLGAPRFAVRSSAAAEDLPDASYAGLYETFLDVEPARLADTVRRCLASAAGDRVRAYHARYDTSRAASGGEDRHPDPRRGMAVLVQPMVDADAAGVAFTANPVTGDRSETVVTAVHGLGEKLVSGTAVGEEWTVRGAPADPQATTVRTRRDTTESDVLTLGEAREVAALARRVAERYQTPQDIEWAIAAGRLHLLQARPITALPDPVQWQPPGPGLWMRNFRLGEWLPEATTPLFADWLLPEIETGFRHGMRSSVGTVVPFRYTTVHGWYYNAVPVPSARLLARAVAQSRGRVIKVLFNALARVGRNPVAADRAVLSGLYRQWRDQQLPAYRSLVASGQAEVDTATRERLVELVGQVGRAAGRHLWFLAIVGGSAWKIEACLAAFSREHLRHVLDDRGGVQVLLRGLPGTEPSIPPHAVTSVDWYQPTAGELAISDSRAGDLAETVGVDRHRQLADQRKAAETACRTALRDRPRQLARFTALLEVTQRYTMIREEQARDFTLGWPLLRRCARRLGDQLRAAGIVDDADDVFFLHRAELESATPLTDLVVRRRAEWQRRCRLTPPLTLGDPPRLVGDAVAKTVDAARGAHDVPEGAIPGHPASAGRATGRVRLVLGPEDFDAFATGEILLTKATAPAWTPLFARAAAVITDGGTLAAHASLVAREYGIPAVVGTGDATARLHSGQLVTVDGTAGTVTPAQATTR